MHYALTHVTRYQPYLPRAAAGLSGVLALSIFLYGTFLLLAVMHTAARTTLEHQVAATQQSLGDAEARYLALTRELTPDRATQLGFVEPVAVSMVYVGPTGALGQAPEAGALSLRTR